MSTNLQADSMRAVFSNDYLREKILDLAIHNDDSSIDRKSLVYVRRVQKTWRTTIDHRLPHQKEPLFTVKLDGSNSLSGTPLVETNGKVLDKFTTFFDGRDEQTFELKLCQEFFCLENYDSLSHALQRCSQGLVQLELVVPQSVGSFPGIFPSRGLPNLQKLTVTFTVEAAHLENLNPVGNAISGLPSSSTILLATLLSQSPNLQQLTTWSRPQNDRTFTCPPGFRYLILPFGIRKLKLNCRMTTNDLEILERNPLGALSELDITVSGPLSEGKLFNILNGCKNTLKVFGLRSCAKGRHTLNLIKLPEMKNLEMLYFVYAFNAMLDDDTKTNLSACLPKLNRLLFAGISSEAVASWTQGTKLTTVRDLSLSLIDRQDKILTPPLLEKILQTMPNVADLALLVDTRCLKDLGPLFEKLGEIKCLGITLVRVKDPIENLDVLDSLLTGLPLEIIRAFRLNPQLEESVEVIVKNGATPSIRQLKNLTTLNLGTDLNGESLLTRMAFKQAFLKMPALKTLILSNRFKVSQDIVQEWEQDGRVIRQE